MGSSDQENSATRLVSIAQRLTALAQNGQAYAEDPFDKQRYAEIRSIGLEIGALASGASVERIAELLPEVAGYATPKVDVRTAVFDPMEQILLVREKSDGCWSLPGGWLDIGETPAEAAAKEVLEESGVHAEVTHLLAVWDKRAHGLAPGFVHAIKLVFEARMVPGQSLPRPDGIETTDVQFFPRNGLPDLSEQRINHSQIEKIYELRASVSGAAAFD